MAVSAGNRRGACQTAANINATARERAQYRAGQMAEEGGAAKGQLREEIYNERIERISRRMGHAQVRPGHQKQTVVFQDDGARHRQHIEHERADNGRSQCGHVAGRFKRFIPGVRAIHSAPSSLFPARSRVPSRNVHRELTE